MTLRSLARALDAVAARLGRLAALLDACAETGEAAERKGMAPPAAYCHGCGEPVLHAGDLCSSWCAVVVGRKGRRPLPLCKHGCGRPSTVALEDGTRSCLTCVSERVLAARKGQPS